MARETSDLPILSLVGVGTAGLAMLMGRYQDSAYVLGASARLRGGDDFTEPTVAWLIDALKPELGDRFDEAYAEGKLLSADAAQDLLDPQRLIEASVG